MHFAAITPAFKTKNFAPKLQQTFSAVGLRQSKSYCGFLYCCSLQLVLVLLDGRQSDAAVQLRKAERASNVAAW